MFISWQTYERIQITVHSLKEVCRFLLEHGVQYILSERVCQDDLKKYLRIQRAIGPRRDNRSVKDAGYKDNTMTSQYSVRAIVGNVRGGEKWNIVDNTSLSKRRKSTA